MIEYRHSSYHTILMSDRPIRPLAPPRNYEGKKDRYTREQKLKNQGLDQKFIDKWNKND